MLRHITQIHTAPARHWVGDGFHVSPLFSHMQGDKHSSPFLMLDYRTKRPARKASARTRTRASRPSPSPCKAKSHTATAAATAAPSPPATCNG